MIRPVRPPQTWNGPSMLEVANSLTDISADRGQIDYRENGSRTVIGDDMRPRLAEQRLLLINAGGAPQGKLGAQLMGLGYEACYLSGDVAELDELGHHAMACKAIILDWRHDAPKDARFAEALAVKAGLLGLPVLTLIAVNRGEDARLASEAGLATILSTPCRLADLKTTLDEILRRPAPTEREGHFGLSRATALLESCKFRFQTPEDIERLVPVVAALFPNPERSAPGLAELMMNAVEHGNLEIGHERKAEWIASGIYRSELMKRLRTPPFSSRWAELIVNRREDGLMIVIMDEGCGFCWQNVISDEARDGQAVAEPCGNGLAKAQRESFDDLRFNPIGNQVTAFVATGSP